MAKTSPVKTVSKLVELFVPQFAWLKKKAAEESIKRGQFCSVNELIRRFVQDKMNNKLKEKNEIKT